MRFERYDSKGRLRLLLTKTPFGKFYLRELGFNGDVVCSVPMFEDLGLAKNVFRYWTFADRS